MVHPIDLCRYLPMLQLPGVVRRIISPSKSRRRFWAVHQAVASQSGLDVCNKPFQGAGAKLYYTYAACVLAQKSRHLLIQMLFPQFVVLCCFLPVNESLITTRQFSLPTVLWRPKPPLPHGLSIVRFNDDKCGQR